jgi:hypothetical protein
MSRMSVSTVSPGTPGKPLKSPLRNATMSLTRMSDAAPDTGPAARPQLLAEVSAPELRKMQIASTASRSRTGRSP